MTIALERPTPQLRYADEALAIIDRYRREVNDRTRVEPLDAEFPYYAQRLGLHGIELADLSDNTSGAFKWRGAFVGASQLKEQGADHLIAPSAGNHARGAILAAKALDMFVTVAVPSSAPHAKREGLKTLWNSHKLRVVTAGNVFDESLAWALQQDGTLLHPYDDGYVIAGQGTVADDILRLSPQAKTVVLPVGGGGLAAGVMQRLTQLGRTDVQVVLAEAEGSNSLSNSLLRYELANADRPNPRFGGSAVRQIGRRAYQTYLDYPNASLVSVPEQAVDTLSELYVDGRRELLRGNTPNFEPTSLVAVAALEQLPQTNGKTVVLATGQNDTIYPRLAPRTYHVPM